MGRDRREDGERPPGPPAAAALERALEREVRERAREEEQGVHPPVHAVEEEHPAPGGERGGGEPGGPPTEARPERPDDRDAGDGKERREKTKRGEPAAQVRDEEGEHEVERRAAAA